MYHAMAFLTVPKLSYLGEHSDGTPPKKLGRVTLSHSSDLTHHTRYSCLIVRHVFNSQSGLYFAFPLMINILFFLFFFLSFLSLFLA